MISKSLLLVWLKLHISTSTYQNRIIWKANRSLAYQSILCCFTLFKNGWFPSTGCLADELFSQCFHERFKFSDISNRRSIYQTSPSKVSLAQYKYIINNAIHNLHIHVHALYIFLPITTCQAEPNSDAFTTDSLYIDMF